MFIREFLRNNLEQRMLNVAVKLLVSTTALAQIVVERPERLDLSLVGERKRPTEAGSCLTRLGVSVRTWSGKLEWLLIKFSVTVAVFSK